MLVSAIAAIAASFYVMIVSRSGGASRP
jgi:hypothetical protein